MPPEVAIANKSELQRVLDRIVQLRAKRCSDIEHAELDGFIRAAARWRLAQRDLGKH